MEEKYGHLCIISSLMLDHYILKKSSFVVKKTVHIAPLFPTVSINLNQTLRTRQLLIDFDAGQPVLSLRAPLDLVNLQSISRPRWPIECEVITDTIHHIGN